MDSGLVKNSPGNEHSDSSIWGALQGLVREGRGTEEEASKVDRSISCRSPEKVGALWWETCHQWKTFYKPWSSNGNSGYQFRRGFTGCEWERVSWDEIRQWRDQIPTFASYGDSDSTWCAAAIRTTAPPSGVWLSDQKAVSSDSTMPQEIRYPGH